MVAACQAEHCAMDEGQRGCASGEPKDAAIVARAGVMGCSWLEDLATDGLGGRGLNCKGCYPSLGLQDPVTLPEAEEKGLPRLKACHLGNNQDEGDCTGRWRRKRWLVDRRGHQCSTSDNA